MLGWDRAQSVDDSSAIFTDKTNIFHALAFIFVRLQGKVPSRYLSTFSKFLSISKIQLYFTGGELGINLPVEKKDYDLISVA